MKYLLAVLAVSLTLGSCSSDSKPADTAAQASETASETADSPSPAPAPTAAPAAVAADPSLVAADSAAAASAGFDPASAPVGQAPTGAWPYFSLMDGYRALSKKEDPGNSATDQLQDVAFDRYELYDGRRVLAVEGRVFTTKAIGKDASFFQVKKTYEKLVKDLGGVTVFEGKSGEQMEEKKLKYEDGRHRGYYLAHDEAGVYMVRTPDHQLWVEVYKPWDTKPNDYWLTIVEQKALEVKVKMLAADEMKKALDQAGHVALYINFDTDKAAMKAEAAPLVSEVVKLLAANPTLKLTVEGHTDNAGTPAHNQELSEARANAVVGALMAQGVTLSRLQAQGFGQTKPLADNATADGRARNRRVELVKR